MKQLISAYYNRGLSYAHLHLLHEAILDFTKAIELDDTDLSCYINRARAYYELGEHEKATQDYSQIINKDNQYVAAYLGRADVFRLQGNLDAAIKDYEEATDIRRALNTEDGRTTIRNGQDAHSYNYKGEFAVNKKDMKRH